MRKYIPILILVSFALSEDLYPYFSDPEKQMKFEEGRIYIREESGERTLTYGGGSTTQIANPLNVILLGETPQYISVARPIETKIEYWYEFQILENNKMITEIEFLRLINLQNRIDQIYVDYRNRLADFEDRIKLADETEPDFYLIERGIVGKLFLPKTNDDYWLTDPWDFWLWGTAATAASFLIFTDWDNLEQECEYWDGQLDYCSHANMKDTWSLTLNTSLVLALLNWQKKEVEIETLKWKYPEYRNLQQPKLEQTLSAEQIRSLAESYNHKIYKQIANE